jgi:hypothetical protein
VEILFLFSETQESIALITAGRWLTFSRNGFIAKSVSTRSHTNEEFITVKDVKYVTPNDLKNDKNSDRLGQNFPLNGCFRFQGENFLLKPDNKGKIF